MYVIGVGNVTECNKSYIHLNDEGKQSSIKATRELLEIIRDQAEAETEFYLKMRAILYEEFEKRRDAVQKKYHFISDEEVEEKNRQSGYKDGLFINIHKQVNNEECTRQYSSVYGFGDAWVFAGECWERVFRLKRQAEAALRSLR
jgi:Rps23 Pro-64 3,4-dihydroxylase Tpa1-like proline 4-hydroxylase